MSKIKLNDPLKSEKQRNELRDINIHRQKLQSKYGDMHTEFVFFTKESEQQNYFSNQVQNYKQLIDELKFQVHQKEEKLLCLQNQNDHLKKQSNDKDSILVEKSSARNQQCLSQKNKSTQSTNFYQRTLDFKAKEDFNAYLSPNSFKLSNSDDGDAFKFKKLDKENVTLGQIGNHNNLHQSQIQATNMKNKIQSVELSLEQISEQILLEEQTQEYLNRMELDTFKSTEKLKAENSRIQDQINSFQTKEQKINNQKLIFKKDYSCVDKELKTAQTYVNQEIQYQQSKVQEKEILFQIQNKQIKESVKLIQKYRNQIQEQEKCKARQLQQIENLEYERQQKEITKKDSELFLKNLGEIDLILKHFVNGNPENLNWEQADMSQQNFEYLFPPETPKINEFNLICNSLQRINQRRPSINIGSLRDQNSLDIQLEKQFSTASSKFQQRDPNQKKSQYFIALPQEITVPKVQQNQVVEKVNQFMKYHSLTPQQIQDKLISYYHSLIFQELTLKNRFSELIEEREQLLSSIKHFIDKNEDLLKKVNQSQFLQKYELKFNQSTSQNCEENTLNELFQIQENVKIHQVLILNQVQSEKFVAKIFYYLNELIFRWCSLINSSVQLSSEKYQSDSKDFIYQVQKNKEISQRIVNLIQNFHEATQRDVNQKQQQQISDINQKINNEENSNQKDYGKEIINDEQENLNKNKEQKIILSLEKFQQDAKNEVKINVSDQEIQKIYSIIKNDFILSNFMQESQLIQFLAKLVQEYKNEFDPCSLNHFEEFYNMFIEKIDDLKNESNNNFKLSLQFLTETLFTILQEVSDQIEFLSKKLEINQEDDINLPQKNITESTNDLLKINIPQLEQLSPIKQNSIMKEEKKNQNTVITTFPTNFMQKKQNRKRINMMKCREFNDYYGYETQKKFSNKAQTILDVIYETLYDFKHGNQTDIFDQNQELNFFLEKRSQTKTIEKDLALQTLEEQLKKNEEIKEKEKNNKTYFMKSKYFEQCSKQNQEITQIEKSYYNEIKKSSTQEQKQSQFSERQMRERRNKIIQEMKQTYSKFHTKYNPITLNAIQEVSDLAQSENKTNVTLNNLKKKNKEESKSSLMKSVQLTNFKINQELFYSSNIQNTDERNANFNCLKKEKVSIFKSGQNARSQNVSPNSSFNDMLRSTEKEISTGGQKTTLEIADNNFFKKFKSLVLSREKQSEATAINKIIEQVRDKNVFNKSENEKASEIYSKDTGIPIAFTTSKFFIEENINDKNKITNQKCIKVKENLKLDLQKLSIQNNNKLLGILTSAQQARMSNNYLRHSLDKLIKIPQPLAYNIINKQTQERYSNQNKNITAESLEKTMKKLITSSQQGSLTERQIPRLSKNIYGIQNYNENNQLSQSYQISKNLVRQAYLDTRQHKSINSFQLNKISSNFQNSNQIN